MEVEKSGKNWIGISIEEFFETNMKPKQYMPILTSSLEGVMSFMPCGMGLFLYLVFENIKGPEQ